MTASVSPPPIPADFRYVEFLVSFHCNYNCSYCFWVDRLKRDSYMFREKGPFVPRTSLRRAVYPLLRRLGLLDYADAFLNYPLQDWKSLLQDLFRGKSAYLAMTGGEPLLLWKQIETLIAGVDEVAREWTIRFDTNGTVVPAFPSAWKSRMEFNVSCHRDEMKDFDAFLRNLDRLASGARSVMVNRVVCTEEELRGIESEIAFFKARGFMMNAAPDHFDLERWSEEGRRILERVIHPTDFGMKLLRQNRGRSCFYPAFGLQLMPNGYAWIPPCDTKVVNLMKTRDASALLSRGAITCPAGQCVCLHQYSFIDDPIVLARNAGSTAILDNYVRAQAQHRDKSGA